MTSQLFLCFLITLSLQVVALGQTAPGKQVEQIHVRLSYIRSKDDTLITYECLGNVLIQPPTTEASSMQTATYIRTLFHQLP
jgi:hypothetical protein